MFSLFFIRRPIFATVVSILIVLAGAAAYWTLPVSQYPEITPPVIRVEARYPGANADVIANTVAQVIEEQVNGVEGMIYMNSTSASDGSYGLDITFELGTNVDIASVLVQNRVSTALPRLPQEVQRQGVTTTKQSTGIVLVMSLAPTKIEDAKEFDDLYLSNFVNSNVRDELSRVPGVGNVRVLPAKDYSMRVWIDPAKLQARGLATTDITDALREQNVQVAAGQIGQPPAPSGQNFQYILTTLGRLETAQQFENIIVKSEGDASTRLKDVAKVELGARSYDTASRLSGKPSATIIIFQQPGANAVEIAKESMATMERLKRDGVIPPQLTTYSIYDVAGFVTATVKEVYKTLYEAIALVVIVVLVFLGNWRATLIPLITIPVSLIGTFFIMKMFGFSINLLTLFALILAIGIVVDDAIVVVENVERNMTQFHLPPREATIRAMSEVFSPIIAISLVLMSVFVPAAFLPGITGQLYRQFALTIAAATLLSAINALTLSPAMAAIFLKTHDPNKKPFIFNRIFNAGFGAVTNIYRHVVSGMITVWPLTLIAFAGLMAATYWTTTRVPTGFLPTEDNGFFVTNVQLPDAASLERTNAAVEKVQDILNHTDGVRFSTALPGFSVIAGNGSNLATVFSTLEDWDERLPKGRDIATIRKEVQMKLFGIQEAFSFTFQFPPIPGLGSSAGFDMRIKATENISREQLQNTTLMMMGEAMKRPDVLRNVNSFYRAGVPQFYVDIDREKVKKLGIPLSRVFDTLQASMGSAYVNDFNTEGRTYQVNVQAKSESRTSADDVMRLQIRGPMGMVPMGSVANVRPTFGPERISRYNMYNSAAISGEAALGASSGQASAAILEIFNHAKQPGMQFEWSAISYQEAKSGGQAPIVFAAGIIVVYLILAAQYESWSLPMSVAMSIPLAIIGAMLTLMIRDFDNNIFTQIGLVLLVGLAAKNAILIVEFARAARAGGKSIKESAVEAAVTRFRPILMTSFAFILGCVPLMIATGAGALSRQAIGTGVVGGMLGATILGVLFIPVLYYVVQLVTEKISRKSFVTSEEEAQATAHAGA